jgi:plasmid stabilization system protein ParE
VKFVLANRAYDDLDEIWDYVAAENENAADAIIEQVYTAIHRLTEYPKIGHYREELQDDSLRVWPVRSYLIVYRENGYVLEVVRVVSGYRDLWEVLR